MSPLDLHVLGTPPAFVLSQDQTLVFNPLCQALLRPPGLSSLRPLRTQHETLWNLRCLLRVPVPSRFPSRGLPFLRVSSFCIVFKVRSAPLPQGPFRTPSRASLHRITEFPGFVNTFLNFFLKKMRKINVSGRFSALIIRTFGFILYWLYPNTPVPTISFVVNFPLKRADPLRHRLIRMPAPHPAPGSRSRLRGSVRHRKAPRSGRGSPLAGEPGCESGGCFRSPR